MCRAPIDKSKTVKKVLAQRVEGNDDPWGLGGGKGQDDVVVGEALSTAPLAMVATPSINAIDDMFGGGGNAVAPAPR